jgi:hypothetical protein
VPVLESTIENRCKTLAENLGYLFVKMNLQGRRGFPDRMVLGYDGFVLFVEFKRKKEKPEPLQRSTHRKLKRRGHSVAVVYTERGFVQALRRAEKAYTKRLGGGEARRGMRP